MQALLVIVVTLMGLLALNAVVKVWQIERLRRTTLRVIDALRREGVI